jgi:hypothetical protein
VSKICRNVFFTLKRLWTRSLHTITNSPQTGHWYCDAIFSKSTASLRERLKVAFNSCARYIFGISRFEHISHQRTEYWEYPLVLYNSYRICCTMYKIIKSGGPRYLFDVLRLGHSSLLFNLLTPAHSTTARAFSFFVQGTTLWNNLLPEVKREGSKGKFGGGCLSHLHQSASVIK